MNQTFENKSTAIVSPLKRYQQMIDDGVIKRDDSQYFAMQKFDSVFYAILEKQSRASSWVARLKGLLVSQTHAIQGLYLWGGVGRGKTFLMDLFYESLPFESKMRTHFHRFMKRVHKDLTHLKGEQDPLPIIAKQIAREASVLCFDEFFVADITDAMIMARLLETLFSEGVILVTTSNIEPSGLYKDGLQRARFLPAIDLLNANTQVVNVDSGIDFRLRKLEKTALYYSPINQQSKDALERCFNELLPAGHEVVQAEALEVEGREIPTLKCADDVVWFDFHSLCDGPRSQSDYIEIAREFHAVILSGVPQMGRENDDVAKRFIYLVDELYDRNVTLIISADVELMSLYTEGRAQFEFQRTHSRLQEMQSLEFLGRGHRGE